MLFIVSERRGATVEVFPARFHEYLEAYAGVNTAYWADHCPPLLAPGEAAHLGSCDSLGMELVARVLLDPRYNLSEKYGTSMTIQGNEEFFTTLRSYDNPMRAYHGCHHLLHLLELITKDYPPEMVADDPHKFLECKLLMLTALMHDVHYFPGCRENAARSAHMAFNSLVLFTGISKYNLYKIACAIMAADNGVAIDDLSRRFIRYDYAVLGPDRSLFQLLEYESLIRREFLCTNPEDVSYGRYYVVNIDMALEYLEGRYKFLREAPLKIPEVSVDSCWDLADYVRKDLRILESWKSDEGIKYVKSANTFKLPENCSSKIRFMLEDCMTGVLGTSFTIDGAGGCDSNLWIPHGGEASGEDTDLKLGVINKLEPMMLRTLGVPTCLGLLECKTLNDILGKIEAHVNLGFVPHTGYER